MAKLSIKKASTDVTVYVFIQDSSATTGAGLTGLTFETASLVASYVRPLAARAALTLATQTVTGAHSDGGFVEVDATNMPGLYRLDLPDAVCATGVNSVVVMLKGAANMAPVLLEIQLTDFDLNTAAITAATIADAVWDEAIADHTTATTFGGKNQKVVPSETIGDYKADVSGLATTTHVQEVEDKVDTIDGNVDAVLLDTGTDGVKIASGELSDLALEATLTAMKGAGWTTETLKAIKDAVDAISAGSGASVDQIWNELTATHTTVGSFAKAITDILQDTGTDIPALITALGAWQATNVTTAVSSGSITDIRGSSWSIAITDLTLDSNKQQFVIKRNVQDADTAALLFVDSATGLIYINGAAGTAGDATLVYAGTTLTLTVKPGATAQLPVGTFHYGIQSVTAAGAVEEPYGGTFTISGDYVRAIT